MRKSQVFVVGLVALGVIAACGVDAVDLASKTCPCPAELTCDPVANRCVPPGSIKPATATPICTPKSCDDLGVECGATNDGCDGLLDCGACTVANTVCIADTHKCACQPKNCADQGAECGEVPSGCGDTFRCPACPGGTNCGGGGPNKCGTAACVPATCASLGACGKISDGCGKILDCGGCVSPAVCGGGGVANKCGCVAKTCAQAGWQCGTGSDGCGGTRTCAGCPGTFVCDSGSHTCKCGTPPVPLTCDTAHWECGTGSDGCGGTLTCRTCSGTEHCTAAHKCDD
ncbi:MAG TPA: hypothetical protein VLT33_26270 [Labilithrix sp.]|nr:hypothetical protein [Labilithrix sp.]